MSLPGWKQNDREERFAVTLMGWVRRSNGNWILTKRGKALCPQEWGRAGFDVEGPDGRKFRVTVREITE